MIFISEKSEETTFEFFAKFCKCLTKMETQMIVNLLNSHKNEYPIFPTKTWYVIGSE